MNYEDLHLVVYQLSTRPDEIEVVLGTNGSAKRPEGGGWKKIDEYALPGNPTVYIPRLLGDESRVRPLIKRPEHRGDQLFVGSRLDMGIQFTIPTSNAEAFAKIVKAMSQT